MGDERIVQVGAPDFEKLAELLLKAKGPSRTMADFAQATGISTSTLSRIVNGKMSKPIKYDVLNKIYSCRDSKTYYSFYSLLAANGMVDKENYGNGRRVSTYLVAQSEENILTRNAKNAIVNALLLRGVAVRKITCPHRGVALGMPYGITAVSDFDLDIEDTSESLWHFTVMDRPDYTHVGIGIAGTRACRFFLIDAWQPDFFKGQKTSFIFFRREAYAFFVNKFQHAPINSSMSAILVDHMNEEIIEESWISEHAKDNSVLNRPISEDTGYVDMDIEPDDEYSEDYEWRIKYEEK